MRMTPVLLGLLLLAAPAAAQTGWFQPALLERPDVKKAIESVDDRATGHRRRVDPAGARFPPPRRRSRRARSTSETEMEKLGLADIRVDDMSNVSGVRKGSGGGPTVVFCAHMDTVFPEGTDLTVKREGDILRAPGVGDDTSNLMAVLEMFRALDRGGVKTKGDLVFLASVQEELGLLGAKHWLETSGYKPDMFIAVDVAANQVWYGALRITQFKFFYTSPGAHTMESRGGPSPAKAVAEAIDARLRVPLPPIAPGLDTFKLPVANVGMIGGGTVFNAVPREAWFTVDLRSLDTPTQDAAGAGGRSRRAPRRATRKASASAWRRRRAWTIRSARPKEERLELAAGADGARRQQSFPQAGHASDRARRRRIDRRQQRDRDGHSGGGHRRDDRAYAASPRGVRGGQQHRPGVKSLIALAVALTTH